MTTADERFLAEAIPDGTFGGPRPETPRPPRAELLGATSPEDQRRHTDELARALDGWTYDEPTRHLHALPADTKPADRSTAA